MIGASFSRGGMDLNGRGIGPTVAAIRAPYGPNGAGVSGGEPLTKKDRAMQYNSAAGAAPQVQASAGIGSPVTVVLGLVGLAALLWLARRNSSYLQQNTLGLNTFNVITIGIVASVWIILSKIVFNKIPAGPITTVVNAL